MSAAVNLPTYEDLQTLLHAALARVNELEADLATRPKKRAPARPTTDACQYCGDTKTEKVLFLGLPMCNGDDYEWTKCASRMRRAKGVPGYAWDRRYSVTHTGRDEPWVARFNGEVIGISPDRGEMRRVAFEHRSAETAAQQAA